MTNKRGCLLAHLFVKAWFLSTATTSLPQSWRQSLMLHWVLMKCLKNACECKCNCATKRSHKCYTKPIWHNSQTTVFLSLYSCILYYWSLKFILLAFSRRCNSSNEQCVRECVYISVCDLKIPLIPPFRKRFAVIPERRTLLSKGSEFGRE